MQYCTRCITPGTRPHITFDTSGVCNACRSHETKPSIDWHARERAFTDVVRHAQSRARGGYDCLIPVSGGKDSTWQVVKCLAYGLNPLAVTWKTPARTDLGAANLANLIALGVDHVDYQVNPRVERKFMLQALTRYGSTAIPMHMALFNIPLTLAARLEIPLIIWGENSAFEYGGDEEERRGFKLDGAWLRRFGVTHGTTAADWISDDLTRRELTPYFGPNDAELERAGIAAVFLGYYFEWDPLTTLTVASQHGFRSRPEGPKTGYYNYADIDDDFISIHHYLKWHKFGFTRSFDNLSIEIRNGRLTRAEAIDWLRRRGDETPLDDIDRFCKFVDLTREGFFALIEKFRNPDVWTRRNGQWVIDGFLIPDWKWS
jgi:N-acetyl sugar amidotransferase